MYVFLIDYLIIIYWSVTVKMTDLTHAIFFIGLYFFERWVRGSVHWHLFWTWLRPQAQKTDRFSLWLISPGFRHCLVLMNLGLGFGLASYFLALALASASRVVGSLT